MNHHHLQSSQLQQLQLHTSCMTLMLCTNHKLRSFTHVVAFADRFHDCERAV